MRIPATAAHQRQEHLDAAEEVSSVLSMLREQLAGMAKRADELRCRRTSCEAELAQLEAHQRELNELHSAMLAEHPPSRWECPNWQPK
jgi:chromosome segregation ATPase